MGYGVQCLHGKSAVTGFAQASLNALIKPLYSTAKTSVGMIKVLISTWQGYTYQ